MRMRRTAGEVDAGTMFGRTGTATAFKTETLGFALFLILSGLLDVFAIAPSDGAAGLLAMLFDLFPISYAIAFLLVGAGALLLPRTSLRARAYVASTVLATALVGLLLLLDQSDPSTVFSIFLLIAFGIGQALAFSCWFEALASCSPKAGAARIVFAYLIAACVQMLSLSSLSPLAFGALAFALVLGNLAALLACGRQRGARADSVNELPQSEPGRLAKATASVRGIASGLWQPLLCITVTGFSLALVRTIASNSIEFTQWGFSIPAIGKLIGIAAVGLIWLKAPAFIKSNRFSLVLFLLIILEFTLLPVFGAQYYLWFMVACGAVFNIAFVVALMYCVELVREKLLFSPAVTGAFFGIMYLAIALGVVVGNVTENNDGYELTGLLVGTLLVFLLIALAAMLANVVSDKRKDDRNNPRSKEPTALISFTEDEVRKNEILATRYRLTKREFDVLVLILGARSVPAIAKVLFVSENTVRSHIKNLYQKLGVHSRQELLDLMADISLETQGRE